MQAMEIKRQTVNRIGIAALAIAVLAAGAVAFILADQSGSRQDAGQSISAASRPAPAVEQAADTRTFEQNTELPTGGSLDRTAPANHDTHRYWQQRTNLSGAIAGPTRMVEETLFIEQNLWLPTGNDLLSMIAPEVLTASPLDNF